MSDQDPAEGEAAEPEEPKIILTEADIKGGLANLYRVPSKYIFSFYGIIDLLSILPLFVELLLPGLASIRVVRILRLLRIFRVLKLVGFIQEASILKDALWGARRKISIFPMVQPNSQLEQESLEYFKYDHKIFFGVGNSSYDEVYRLDPFKNKEGEKEEGKQVAS